MLKYKIILVLDNVRSLYNVGSIFRTADAVGVSKIILTGMTPYPAIRADKRLPHVRKKAHEAISKTALGAESSVPFEYIERLEDAVSKLKRGKFKVYALEQTRNSKNIFEFVKDPSTVAPANGARSAVVETRREARPSGRRGDKIGLIIGHETEGVDEKIISKLNGVLEIPMYGSKESLNVSVAAGIALYALRNI